MSSDISCILTTWRRTKNLGRQLQALSTQSLRPDHIVLWHNEASLCPLSPEIAKQFNNVVSSRQNLGVWPRFLFGMELQTKYICMFDDDTIPGTGWLANCMTQMAKTPGLYGTVGVIYKDGRRNMTRTGWPAANQHTTEVDIVGHSWFYQRDWLRYYALEPRRGYSTCGEDYHFSFVLQKHLKLGTYVPPHPPNAKQDWGSLHGQELGMDGAALCLKVGENDKKLKTHSAYVAAGWRPLELRKAKA